MLWEDLFRGWEQRPVSPQVSVNKHHLFLVGVAHTGNFSSLGLVLVDTEISHSCPKALGCSKGIHAKLSALSTTVCYIKKITFSSIRQSQFPCGFGVKTTGFACLSSCPPACP